MLCIFCVCVYTHTLIYTTCTTCTCVRVHIYMCGVIIILYDVIIPLAFFGLLGSDPDDDDPTKVPPSVKRYLLKAHRYRRSGAYQRAERACHQALKVLATSKHSSSQAYTEAKAYVLDAVSSLIPRPLPVVTLKNWWPGNEARWKCVCFESTALPGFFLEPFCFCKPPEIASRLMFLSTSQ